MDSVGKTVEEVAVCLVCRGLASLKNIFLGEILKLTLGNAVFDVVEDGSCEQNWVLRDKRNM